MQQEKTKLQLLLFSKGITVEKVKEVIEAKQSKTASEKLHHKREWKLSEMKAIQQNLFPEYTLEELFEGY